MCKTKIILSLFDELVLVWNSLYKKYRDWWMVVRDENWIRIREEIKKAKVM